MVVISARELVQSKDKYFDLALSQPIYLKRRKHLFEIRLLGNNNPSPSGDSYFDNPKNVDGILADVEQARQEKKEGKLSLMTKKEAISHFKNL